MVIKIDSARKKSSETSNKSSNAELTYNKEFA